MDCFDGEEWGFVACACRHLHFVGLFVASSPAEE